MSLTLPTTIQPSTVPAGLANAIPFFSAIQQKRDDAKLMAWAMEEYSKCKNQRLPQERDWYIELAFYAGKQYIEVIPNPAANNGFSLSTPKAPPWRVRMVVNLIRPICRGEMSKLTAQKPTFQVIPATEDDKDYAAARAGEAIVEATWRDKKLDIELKRSVFWQVVTGCGYMKSYWDANKIDIMSSTAENKVKGDLCVDRISPFSVYIPDLTEEEIENQPYVIHASARTKEWVQATYGFGEVSENTATSSDILEDSFLNLTNAPRRKVDHVLCLEFWIKPGMNNKFFPGGGVFTVVGDKIFRNADRYPYDHNEYPFYKLDAIPTGKFYAESTVKDLIPLQREYNRTKSQMIEAKNLMAKPQLIAAKGSVNVRMITSEPGQVIQYNLGMPPPAPLQMQNLPQHVPEELDRLRADMDDLSAQHEISRGNTPSQVTAATAISFLQEQDDSKIAYATASIEAAVEKLGRHTLSYATQYWTVPRLIRTTGKDDAFEVMQLKSDSLQGIQDLRVEAGSALPRSKAARQSLIMDLLKLGVVDPTTGLEVLDLGGLEKVFEAKLVDKRQPQRENLRMAQMDPQELEQIQTQMPIDQTTGQPIPGQPDPQALLQKMPVNTWDNHQSHIEYHNMFRKTQEFELLADPIKQLFEMHVQMHVAAMGNMQQPMLPDGTAGLPVAPPPTMDAQGQPVPPNNEQAQLPFGAG